MIRFINDGVFMKCKCGVFDIPSSYGINNTSGSHSTITCTTISPGISAGSSITLKPGELWTVPYTGSPTATTKASKDDSEKPDLSLIPYSAQIAEAKAMMVGAKKYGRDDFRNKPGTITEHIAAILRHAQSYLDGEDLCPVDGQPHLGSIRARTGIMIEQQKLGLLLDDRFKNKNTVKRPEEK